MWPWKRPASNLEVMERIESVERRFKLLAQDVDDFFDSVRRAENRIKHKQKVLDSERTSEEDSPDGDAPNEPLTHPGPALSARQKQIQQLILRRRAGVQ